MKPAGIALRVVVAFGVLLAPIGGMPHLARRVEDLVAGVPLTPWGWAQMALHGGVPLALFWSATRAIRRRRATFDQTRPR